MKRVLITGAAGFIGSSVAETLLARHKSLVVVGLDNFDDNYPVVYKKRNVSLLRKYPNFNFYKADIRHEDVVRRIFKKERPDTVIHLAAKVDTRHAVLQPKEYLSTNIDGTRVLLECAKEFGVERFVFASSSSVYGNTGHAPIKESDSSDFPISPYGASKKAGEMLSYAYHHNFKLPVTVVRIFNAYGPRMRTSLVLYKWVEKLFSGESIEISGGGTRTRDFTYITDLVDALIRAARDRTIAYEIVNVGSSKPISLKKLLRIVEKEVGVTAHVTERKSSEASVESTHASVRRAKELLGWEPTTSIDEGVSLFVAWFRAKRAKELKKRS